MSRSLWGTHLGAVVEVGMLVCRCRPALPRLHRPRRFLLELKRALPALAYLLYIRHIAACQGIRFARARESTVTPGRAGGSPWEIYLAIRARPYDNMISPDRLPNSAYFCCGYGNGRGGFLMQYSPSIRLAQK